MDFFSHFILDTSFWTLIALAFFVVLFGPKAWLFFTETMHQYRHDIQSKLDQSKDQLDQARAQLEEVEHQVQEMAHHQNQWEIQIKEQVKNLEEQHNDTLNQWYEMQKRVMQTRQNMMQRQSILDLKNALLNAAVKEVLQNLTLSDNDNAVTLPNDDHDTMIRHALSVLQNASRQKNTFH